MGWWWSSNSTTATRTRDESALSTVVDTPTTTHREEAPSKAASPDSDFEALFASFEKPPTPSTYTRRPEPTDTNRIPQQHPSEITPAPTNYVPSPSGTHEQQSPSDAPLDISPQALYPRQMSCRQAFDQAFYCQSLGGKFNDIYRYGELRSCSDNWNAFWFCMRIKTLPDTERQERIKDFYQAKDELNKAEKGNSELIWDIRTEPVEKAFWKNPDDVTETS